MQIDLGGIHRVRKRLARGDIKTYYYAWRGGPRINVDIRDQKAFAAEFHRLTCFQAPERDASTISHIISLYCAAADYTGLSKKTKEGYDTALVRIKAKFGTMPIEALEEKGARSIIRQWRDDDLSGSPRSADLTMAVFTKVLNFAKDEELILRNPLDALTKLSSGTRKDIIWSDDQMALFAAVGPTHLVRAMILAKWTGQRQADLLKLTWLAYDGEYIRLQQGKAGRGKAGKRVKILVSAELRATLETIRDEQKARAEHPDPRKRKALPATILTTENGVPWKSGFKASWGAAVKDTARRSGETFGVTFHDFRGTFITLAYRAGVAIKDIAEASGHDEKECERVIRQHYLASGADEVIQKLESAGSYAAKSGEL
ncbi:MAG: tyrosine-type recombinase/integrase [Devosia sp.]